MKTEEYTVKGPIAVMISPERWKWNGWIFRPPRTIDGSTGWNGFYVRIVPYQRTGFGRRER
jgi:hypothetical protein